MGAFKLICTNCGHDFQIAIVGYGNACLTASEAYRSLSTTMDNMPKIITINGGCFDYPYNHRNKIQKRLEFAFSQFALDEEETEEAIRAILKNDYDSQWIMREGKRLNIKIPDYPFIERLFKRRILNCNRRGMGLRIRRRFN